MRLVSLCISVCVLSICGSEFDRGFVYRNSGTAFDKIIMYINYDIHGILINTYINCMKKKKKILEMLFRNIIHNLPRAI